MGSSSGLHQKPPREALTLPYRQSQKCLNLVANPTPLPRWNIFSVAIMFEG